MQTFLAFDYGVKRIGIAVGNSYSRLAQPLKTLQNKNMDETFIAIQKLVKEWEVNVFVVGLYCTTVLESPTEVPAVIDNVVPT